VIVDTKRVHDDFADPRWGVISSDPIAICYEPRVVWQPDLHSPRGQADFERGLDLIYNVRGDPAGAPSVTVLLDEAKHCAPTEPNPLLARMVFSGMGRGIGIWALSQTRYKVYPNLFSDAFVVISFRVQSASDRATLERDIGVECRTLMELEDHQWVYWRQGRRKWSPPNISPP
jgi:hypothetical protein